MSLLSCDLPVNQLLELPILNQDQTTFRTVADSGSGSAPPLSETLYVDQVTLVPLAEQNGSITAPFATITQAIAAIGTTTKIVLQSYDYSAEGPIVIPPTTWNVEFVGQEAQQTNIQSISSPSAAIYLRYINVQEISNPTANVTLHKSNVISNVTCQDIEIGEHSGVFGDIDAIGTITVIDGGYVQGNIAGQSLIARHGRVNCAGATVQHISAIDSLMPDVVDLYSVSADCTMTNCWWDIGGGTWTFTDVAGQLLLDGNTNCSWKTKLQTLVNGAKTIITDLVP